MSDAQHPSLPYPRGECSIINFGFVTHQYISFDNAPQVRIVLLDISCLPVVQHRCEGRLIHMRAQRQVGHRFPEALLMHSSNGPDTHACCRWFFRIFSAFSISQSLPPPAGSGSTWTVGKPAKNCQYPITDFTNCNDSRWLNARQILILPLWSKYLFETKLL